MPRSRKRDGLYRRENGIFAFRFKSPNAEWREKYTGSTDRAVALSFKRGFLTDLEKGTLPTEMAMWRLDQAETLVDRIPSSSYCTKHHRFRALSPPAFPSHIDQQALARDLER
jgi:hypothetical protein